MSGKIAHVAEQDDVAVLTLAVHADAADGVLVDWRARIFARRLALEVRFFLEAVHEELEAFVLHASQRFLQPLLVDQLQPDVVLRRATTPDRS